MKQQRTAPDPAAKRLRCLLVEDEHLAITMMVQLIRSRSELLLVGIAKYQEQFFRKLDECDPDIVFLDIGIPPGSFGAYRQVDLRKDAILIVVSGYRPEVYRPLLSHVRILELPKPVSRSSFHVMMDKIIQLCKSDKAT
ncbi:MAG: hypothetical protein QHC79_25725 [Pseudosphingobacterium sp.]|nr:hypothetical protein [Pseudosphingobacterium sp.]